MRLQYVGSSKPSYRYNEAQAMGIRVFRAHAENIRTGEFFALMERVLSAGQSC